MFNPVSWFFLWIVRRLTAIGLVDEHRGRRIADLTWPRFLTMFTRKSQRVADVAMVGLTMGPTAIAGLALATVYWELGNGLSLGLAGGTINQVSQRFGADKHDRLDLAVKQSVLLSVIIALPFTLVYWLFAEQLISVLTSSQETIEHGAAYLSVLSVAMLFNFLNTVSSRTLAGADDTWISMVLRATGGAANIVFNAIFIFGLGMGVEGAALGTVIAELIVAVCFAWGFVTGSLPLVGEFPVRVSLGGPYVDVRLTRQLLLITPPLMARSLARTVAEFPLFAMLALFGPAVIAAFEVGRRVRDLLSAFGSGFSMSASSVVGQELGRSDEPAAEHYSWDVIRFSAAVYVVAAASVFVFASSIAQLFVDDPTHLPQTATFVRVAAISFVGYGFEYTFSGILIAAGDNTWTMYGRLAGQYLLLLPLTYLGVVTPLGLVAVYLAIVAETWTSGLVTGYRFFSGKWRVVARTHRTDVSGE